MVLSRLRAAIGLNLADLFRELLPIWIGIAAMALALKMADVLLPTSVPTVGRLAIQLSICAFATACIALAVFPKLIQWLRGVVSMLGGTR